MKQNQDYSLIDTGLRFKGHPVLLGSTEYGRRADKHTLTCLDKFLKRHLSENIVELMIDHSTGTIVKGAIHD